MDSILTRAFQHWGRAESLHKGGAANVPNRRTSMAAAEWCAAVSARRRDRAAPTVSSERSPHAVHGAVYPKRVRKRSTTALTLTVVTGLDKVSHCCIASIVCGGSAGSPRSLARRTSHT